MTNLEFIEEQIEYFKNNIKFFEDLLKHRENPSIPRKEDDSKFDLLTINDLKIKIKDNYEMLNYCNKIKTDLEAWEVVKTEVKDFFSIRIHNNITDKDWEKIKKALKRNNTC